MGGYGALKLGLAKPESFAAVASLSGAVSLSSTSFGELLKVRKRSYWEGIFGPLDQIEGSIHDPLYLLQQLVESQTEMPQFYLCCGEQDMLLSANQQMAQALNRHRQVTLLKLDQENMTGCSGMNGFKSLGLATNTKIEKVVFNIYFKVTLGPSVEMTDGPRAFYLDEDVLSACNPSK